MNEDVNNSAGLILAGGQSSRMQYQDKALLPLGDKRVIDYILASLTPQVSHVVINANRNLDTYAQLGAPILKDDFGPQAGPIAGIYTAMAWLREHQPQTQALFCCPSDVPWFPPNTVAILAQAMHSENASVAWLCTDGQKQPLFSLWSTRLLRELETALAEQVYSPMALILSLPNTMVSLQQCPLGHFANLNTPEDLEVAQGLLQRGALT